MTGEKNTAPQVLYKTPGESRLASIDFGGKMTSGELLTGTPTIVVDYSIPSGATALTLANKAVSTAALTINGRTVAIGEAVQFLVSGGGIEAEYIVKITVSSDSTPAQSLEGFLHVVVEQE